MIPTKPLVITAVASSLVTLGCVTLYGEYSRRRRRVELADDVRRTLEFSPPGHALPDPFAIGHVGSHKADEEYGEELIREQLARNYAFFGEEGMERVRKGSVVVVGCGGVGSWAAVMLVRSGISKIRLVDFDYVTLSSLNRHATALLEDVGTPKVKCVARTLRQISRWVHVDPRVELWKLGDATTGDLGTAEELLEGADWVIDAIDNITTKVELLRYCNMHGIKVFSSMGAGAKCDPTRIQIGDISETTYDPLARSVRRRLRLGTPSVASGIPVVYSTEVGGDVKLLPLPEEEFQKGRINELTVFDDFRVRILPVLGPLPSIFGLHIATYIVCHLAGKPILNPLPVRHRKKLYEKLLRDFMVRESLITNTTISRLPISEEDVGFLLEDLHRGRSVIPPHAIPSKPTLTRWAFDEPVSLLNIAVMEKEDVERHERECLPKSGDKTQGVKVPEEVWGREVANIIARRQEEVREVMRWAL